MKIVCCANMPFAKEAFSTLGETLVKDGRTVPAADVRDAEILAIRSTTKVNEALLKGSKVRFVGTATIGYDHIDTGWLKRHGIPWCFAAGCNANSVSEYFTAALLVNPSRAYIGRSETAANACSRRCPSFSILYFLINLLILLWSFIARLR